MFIAWCRRMLERLRSHLVSPAMFVGNPERVRKPGEEDGDAAKLRELNRARDEMLRDHPWTKKLATHLRLLSASVGLFALVFWLSGLFFPSKHPIYDFIFAGLLATAPYWMWWAGWNRRIEDKVWEAFTKKFGKHFHRR